MAAANNFLLLFFTLLNFCTLPYAKHYHIPFLHKIPQLLFTPPNLQKLVSAYPDHLLKAEGNILFWRDGTQMIYNKQLIHNSYEELLSNADLHDQMAQEYPRSAYYPKPPHNFDPGRARHAPFFNKMYGSSAKQVTQKLKPVHWLRSTSNEIVLITSVNNVHKIVQAISDELDTLPDSLKKFVRKIAGTFNWRSVAGTNRLSPHSWGIAIDIDASYSDYWLWDKQNKKTVRSPNRIPMEIVTIFEKHGFIWGGKWYHYDTMHFEYRPELL